MSRIAFYKFIICVFYQAFKQLGESIACLRTYNSEESEVLFHGGVRILWNARLNGTIPIGSSVGLLY